MWLRPNPALTDEGDILLYAISVDGYEYARVRLGRDLFEMVDDLRRSCLGPRLATAKFADLRLLLFFTQRAWRHCHQGGSFVVKADDGTQVTLQGKFGPDEQEVAALRDLHAAICDAWQREWPARSGRAQAT